MNPDRVPAGYTRTDVHRKQLLLTTLSSTISPDLVTGWKSSIGNSVRGEIVGLSKHNAVSVFVRLETDGSFSANTSVGWTLTDQDQKTPADAVYMTIREWAKHQTFDHLPKSVRDLLGVAEDAQEKKRKDLKVRISEWQHRIKYLNSERDRLTVKIDQENTYLTQLEEQLKTMETQ